MTHHASVNGYKAVKRSDLPPGAWNTFCDQHIGSWWWHREEWMAYALAYAPGSEDRSVAAVDESGTIRGIRPQIVLNGRLTHGGQDTPVSLIDLSLDAQGAVEAVCCLFPAGSAVPGRLQGPVGLDSSGGETYVVDLQADEAVLWSRVRRSYHSLVHAAERRYAISVLSGTGEGHIIRTCQRLHLAASGRRTRADATWDLMGDWLNNAVGIVAVAFDHEQPVPEMFGSCDECFNDVAEWLPLVGYAYGIRYKNYAYWASGATLRPNVQAALQWAIMKALRSDGSTRFYELGYAAGPDASSKEQGIGYFKAAWGGIKMGRSVIEVGV